MCASVSPTCASLLWWNAKAAASYAYAFPLEPWVNNVQSLPDFEMGFFYPKMLIIPHNNGRNIPWDLNAVRDWIFGEVNLARAQRYPWSLC